MPILDENCISASNDIEAVMLMSVDERNLLSLVVACDDTRYGEIQEYATSPLYLYVDGIPPQLFGVGMSALAVGGSQREDPNIVDLSSDILALVALEYADGYLLITAQLRDRVYNANPTMLYLPGLEPQILHARPREQ